MSQGEIRRGKENSKKIPLETPIMLLTIQNKKIQDEKFNGTKDGRSLLIKRIRELENRNEYFKIYGIWNGQWNTHLFDMDITILKKRIEEAGVYSWAKDD